MCQTVFQASAYRAVSSSMRGAFEPIQSFGPVGDGPRGRRTLFVAS